MDTFALDLLVLRKKKSESLIDYTNLFSPNKFEMNEILETFMNRF